MDAAPESLERAYRQEATRIRAALAARTGDLGLAEDAVQDAFVEAIEHWPRDGVPASPGGWLATTARRKAARPAPPGQGRRAQAGPARGHRPGGLPRRPGRGGTATAGRPGDGPTPGERTGRPTTSC